MILLAILIVIVLSFGFVVLFGAPYVPSMRRDVASAFEALYPISKTDLLVDIGSGDGVVLREAAKRGARAVGYEINPLLVLISRLASAKYRGVEVRLANLFKVSFPDQTTVVYVFGESRDIEKMFVKIGSEASRLGRPLTVISYGFKSKRIEASGNHGAHFMYVIKPHKQDKKPRN